MALNVEYVARETVLNLRRNLLMAVASVLTVAVSLTLAGVTLLLRQAVNNATLQWRGGIEFVVYLEPDVTEEESAAVAAELAASPLVSELAFLSKDEAYDEFTEIFRGSPELVDAVDPEILPPSYRVVPTDPDDTEGIAALGDRFDGYPGVYQVTFAREQADAIISTTGTIRLVVTVAAVALSLSAGVLILNTIRLAIFARRREIEVMKLVGATNWFIRVPLMLEGLLQGLLGAVVAAGAVVGIRNWVADGIRNNDFWGAFSVSTDGLVFTAAIVVLAGMAIGALSSAMAVRRFLDV